MNEYQQKWLHELRSGGHRQGQAALVSDADPDPGKAYCCLGVAACFVFGDDRADENTLYLSTLSPEYLSALDLSPDDEHHIAHLNDNEQFTFTQIADVLELSFETGNSPARSARDLFGYLFEKRIHS